MEQRDCKVCKERFIPRPNVRNQVCCGKRECRKQYKLEKHREAMAKDPVYRDGQRDANKQWRESNKSYWRDYRKKNPKQAERNRQLQRLRNANRKLQPEQSKGTSLPSPDPIPLVAVPLENQSHFQSISPTSASMPTSGYLLCFIPQTLTSSQKLGPTPPQFADRCLDTG